MSYYSNGYYNIADLYATGADIMIGYGPRGNGKTEDGLRQLLEDHFKYGYKIGYVRRQPSDIKSNPDIPNLFASLVDRGFIDKYSNGDWNNVYYYGRKYYFSKVDDEGNIIAKAKDCFCSILTVYESGHYRGSGWANYNRLLFDEFIPETDEGYLSNEFTKFVNLLESVRRNKTDFKILLLGNTISKYNNLYFKNLGITHYKEQEQGTIDIYESKDKKTKIAVEYTEGRENEAKESFYSMFQSEAIDMIMNGGWQSKYAPEPPVEFTRDNIRFSFYLLFDDERIEGDIISAEKQTFLYLKRMAPEKDINEDKELIFQQGYSAKRNIRRNILKPFDNVGNKIAKFFDRDLVFYEDNDVGELVRTYLNWCKTA